MAVCALSHTRAVMAVVVHPYTHTHTYAFSSSQRLLLGKKQDLIFYYDFSTTDMDSSIDDAEEETAGPSSIHPPVPNTFRSPDASTSARASCSSSKSNKKSVTQEITSLISSVLEQQRRDHELFMLKEDQRLEREMEMERERYRLHMEMEERRRQAQIESDQATMRLIA